MEKEITTNSEKIIKHLFYISEPSLFSWFKDKALEPSLLEEIKNINELFPFIPLMFVTNKQVSAIARFCRKKLSARIRSGFLHRNG